MSADLACVRKTLYLSPKPRFATGGKPAKCRGISVRLASGLCLQVLSSSTSIRAHARCWTTLSKGERNRVACCPTAFIHRAAADVHSRKFSGSQLNFEAQGGGSSRGNVDQAGSYERPVAAPLVGVKLRGGTGPIYLYRSDVRPFLKEILEDHSRLGVQAQKVSLATLCVR